MWYHLIMVSPVIILLLPHGETQVDADEHEVAQQQGDSHPLVVLGHVPGDTCVHVALALSKATWRRT